MCSPLSVRYNTIEMTAIVIIIMAENSPHMTKHHLTAYQRHLGVLSGVGVCCDSRSQGGPMLSLVDEFGLRNISS